jgi:outer membrane protein assembly factor BamB
MVGVDGRIYVTARDGTTVVLKHGDAVEVLATNTVGEAVDASPAIVGDVMYIRGAEHLFCIDAE